MDDHRREGMIREQRLANIGYKEGIFKSRTAHIQEGFDRGYADNAMLAFCKAFVDECSLSKDDAAKEKLGDAKALLDAITSEQIDKESMFMNVYREDDGGYLRRYEKLERLYFMLQEAIMAKIQ